MCRCFRFGCWLLELGVAGKWKVYCHYPNLETTVFVDQVATAISFHLRAIRYLCFINTLVFLFKMCWLIKLIILNPQKRSNSSSSYFPPIFLRSRCFFLWIICQSKKIGWARDLRLSSLDQRWNAEICLPKLPCDYTIYIIYTYIIIIHKCEISWISFLPHVMWQFAYLKR